MQECQPMQSVNVSRFFSVSTRLMAIGLVSHTHTHTHSHTRTHTHALTHTHSHTLPPHPFPPPAAHPPYLEGAAGDVGSMQRLLAGFGGFDGAVFGVAEVLAGQRVHVDQLAKTAKGVLQHVRRQSARMTHDEQTLSVTDRVV